MNRILFQPFRLHDPTLPNRIVLSPMSRSRAGAARLPNRLMAEYYSQRSSAGLLVPETTSISEETEGWSDWYSPTGAKGYTGFPAYHPRND